MAIDPQIEALYEKIRAAGRPPIWEQTPEAARSGYRALVRLAGNRDIPVGRVEDRTICGAESEIMARFYTPVAAGGAALPCLIYFHGGGFVIGDLETHDTLCRGLSAEAECRVIAVNYRLAPEHKFPAAVEDGYAAVKWIEANASTIGVDANRIAVGGDSAGGTLAAVVCQMIRDKGGPKIVYQMLFYPATHRTLDTQSRKEFAADLLLHEKSRAWFETHYFAPDTSLDDPRASPLITENLGGLPPAYVMTAGNDMLRDEGRLYADRLREAGVPVEYVCYEQMVHGFLNLSGIVDTARVAITRAGQALKVALA